MHWFEVILAAVAWGVQIGCILLLAALVTAGLAWGSEILLRKKRGKFLPRFLITALLLCGILTALAASPPVICTAECRGELTDAWREELQAVSAGLHSTKIPLVPLFVRVTEVDALSMDGVEEYRIVFNVHYFCMGTQGMEYSTRDGFNSVDPVFQN